MLKARSKDMLTGPLFTGIVGYTVPIILTSLLQLMFNAADLMVVGRFCGSVSVAAVGATGAVTNLIVNLFIGLSVGAGVAVAHGLGSRDWHEVHRTVHTALPVALVSGAVLTVVGILCAGTFLSWMGTPEKVLPLSTLYMQVYFGGIIFSMVYNFSASILRAAGDTRSPLIYLTFAGVLNVALNVVFVTVFHMNVAGVALATVLSQALSAVLVVRALMRREDACRLELRKMQFYSRQLRKMVRIGLPAGVQGSLFSISNVMVQSSVNSFGDVFMSGNAAAGNIEGFLYVMLNAFHQTAVNFVGQNAGARRYDRVKKTLWICMGCVMVAGLVAGNLVYGFGRQLLEIYITDSAQAVQDGMTRLAFMCVPYFLFGLMDVSTGALRGLGSSVPPMIICVMGVCGLRLTWIYTVFQLPQYHTPECLFFSYPLSWLITFSVQMIAYVFVFRKRLREDACLQPSEMPHE